MTLVKKYNRFPFFPSMFDDELMKSISSWPGTMHHSASIPAVNINEKEDSFVIDVAVPGMKKEDFKVELNNNILTISSERENKSEESGEKGQFTRKEFHYSSFSRSFTIPEKIIDQEKISGSYENGILQLILPKKTEVLSKGSRNIEIR